jgi:hypothetical protein
MGTVTVLSFCTVILLFQPAAPIAQTQLGKPGEPAPAAPVAQSPAPAPVTAAPANPTPPAPAPAAAVAPPAPVTAPAAPAETGGRVAAFWVLLPN